MPVPPLAQPPVKAAILPAAALLKFPPVDIDAFVAAGVAGLTFIATSGVATDGMLNAAEEAPVVVSAVNSVAAEDTEGEATAKLSCGMATSSGGAATAARSSPTNPPGSPAKSGG